MGTFERFLAFALVSGVGWALDFSTFAIFALGLGFSGGAANFISSYVGVTFVWFISLKKVFQRAGAGQIKLLFFYWAFQFFSIVFYSKILKETQFLLIDSAIFAESTSLLIAKIAVTPFNLLTNYVFMKWVSGFIRPDFSAGS